MKGKSQTPQEVKLQQLKEILPEAFTEGKVDWEKLKATLGEDINFANERYVLNWAGKSEAFKVLQTPTTKSLIPAKEESVNFDQTEHIFIEGENLEVLKVLQKSYFGKVKMIYIDPPYNTGNDSFIYPDKFSETRADYEKRVGDKDEEGYMTKDGMFKRNSKENGQYHSNWLNMMMPRLYLAKNLLRQDGVIFVSIDDNEVHNLRLLMNEVFGEENFVADFLWKKKGTTSNVEGAQVSSLVDNTLCYRKSEKASIKPRIKLKETRSYPYNDSEGNYRLTVIEKKDSGSYKRDSMKFEIIGYKPREGKRWQIGIDTAKELEKK
ncbi:MAG: site-specific DNA-methyltransferase, partial [Dysgonamonadaceae bacterium]